MIKKLTKKKIGEHMKSPEMREERRLSMTGDRNPMKKKEIAEKVSLAHTGKNRSNQMKHKTAERMKGNKYNLGKQNNKGKHWKLSEETKRKQSEAKKGEKSYNWQGGISRGYRKGYKNDIKYKEWRSNIFERDNWTCQTCGARGCYLEPHHIKGWSKYPKLRYELSNGVTLCLPCHQLTDNYRGKKQ